jgi:NADPH:quinone reductase-like Zn-dependent oxidoreductase
MDAAAVTARETTMKAIVQDRYGGLDALELREIDKPVPKDDEVLVRVQAAGLDRGVWAEYASAPEDHFALKPAALSFEQAAAVPISAFAALQALRDVGEVQPGHKVLVIGAAGGVGSFAVQLAKAFGAHVTWVGSTAQLDLVRSIGADDVVDYTRHDVTDGSRRWDLVLDTAGHRSLSRFVGQRLRMLSSKPRPDDLQTLEALVEAGDLRPLIDRTYPLPEVPEAIRHLVEGHGRGKIAITVPGPETG